MLGCGPNGVSRWRRIPRHRRKCAIPMVDSPPLFSSRDDVVRRQRCTPKTFCLRVVALALDH